VNKNLDGRVPEPGEFSAEDTELLTLADGLLARVREAFDAQAMHQGLEAIWLMLGAANRYFSAQEPWVLRKSEAEADQLRFRTVLYTTLEAVRIAAVLIQPVMPASAARLLEQLGQWQQYNREFAKLGTRLKPGTMLPPPTGVFPRYEIS
jgi:methionyl-tRNA synthetase